MQSFTHYNGVKLINPSLSTHNEPHDLNICTISDRQSLIFPKHELYGDEMKLSNEKLHYLIRIVELGNEG